MNKRPSTVSFFKRKRFIWSVFLHLRHLVQQQNHTIICLYGTSGELLYPGLSTPATAVNQSIN
ncbi:MAG: hypothetical protein A1D16_05555 [Flavihumibacter sp. CACIAM 22H1]|nr:MAG: hypothetical protein A1D16_05555 [Flavihumibacter sp. CACIAM 22H1]